MSILLDALRKSEKQKHLGDVPTIYSSPSLESPNRRPLKPGLLIMILLPALIVAAWYGWQWFNRAEGNVSAPIMAPVEAGPQEQDRQTEAGAEPVNLLNELPPIPQPVANTPMVADERTPVESYSPPQTVGTVHQEPEKPPVTEIRADRPASALQPATTLNEPAQAGTATYLSAISYWRLPDSIREEFVRPKISVLVFAEHAEDRFILVNGRRFVEGDELQAGLVLNEISREGAVFSYRLYQFLVTQ